MHITVTIEKSLNRLLQDIGFRMEERVEHLAPLIAKLLQILKGFLWHIPDKDTREQLEREINARINQLHNPFKYVDELAGFKVDNLRRSIIHGLKKLDLHSKA